jgi:hypothetical protein
VGRSKREQIEKHVKRALDDALKLAGKQDVDDQPGWRGPVDE